MGRRKEPIVLQDLTTPFENGSPHAWDIYPRPQMRRDSYYPLNGAWELSMSEEDSVSQLTVGTIEVPFPPESKMGRVRALGSQSFGPIVTLSEPRGRSILPKEKWIYEKKTEVPSLKEHERLWLHFGAVDQIAYIYVNDQYIGEHRGGYLPFSFDITDQVMEGLNTIRVEVKDPLDPELPYGKQRKDRGGMWYTPFSGIWQSVFMEVVPETGFHSLRITPSLHAVTIKIEGGRTEKTLILETAK